MSTLIEQLYSRNTWLVDSPQTVWNFTFAGPQSAGALTYLDRAHVVAYTEDGLGGRYDYAPQDADWLGDYQLQLIPAPPVGNTLTIARETPRERPLVDYNDGAAVSEPSLDTNARQAVYLAQEALDRAGLRDDSLGYKALKHVLYTGPSVLAAIDNGRTHYKTDGTDVVIPSTIPVEYLTTITNNSDVRMTVTFADPEEVAHRQGIEDTIGVNEFVVPARNSIGATKNSQGHWFINGFIL